jgi:PAS domain S-box-containing protein
MVADPSIGRPEVLLGVLLQNVEDYVILFTDPEGRITVWGEGAERNLGYSAQEAMGRYLDFFFTAEDQARGLLQTEIATATEEGRATDDNWVVRKDGSRFWANGTLTAVLSEEDRLVGFAKIFRDLTGKRRAEQDRNESRRRLSASLAAARMGVWTLDGETRIQTRDENLNALLGLPPLKTSLPFDEFLTHVHAEDRHHTIAAFERMLQAAEPLNVEFWIVRPDGSIRWLRDQGDIFGEPKRRRLTAGACLDITERREAEEALKRAKEELESRVQERTVELAKTIAALDLEATERKKSDQDRQKLLARLVNAQEDERRRIARDLHDSLGQYVTALNLGLKTLKTEVVEGPPLERIEQLTRLAKEIGQETHRLATDLRPRALDDLGLKSAIEQVLTEWTKRTKIPVDFECRACDEDQFPIGVSTAVYRVVQESLTNIAKHAAANSVTVLLERAGGRLVVVVEDDGKGFDTEDAFGRNGSGQRLGLLGMKERAELVGGVLDIESTPGDGTIVLMRIPLSSSSAPGG